MTKIVCLICIVSLALSTKAQNNVERESSFNLLKNKPVIDSNSYKDWPAVGAPRITNNGEYIYYSIQTRSGKNNKAFLKASNGDWQIGIADNGYLQFTEDSKFAILQTNDTLSLIKLGVGYVEVIHGVKSTFVPQRGNEGWILYSYIKNDTLVLRNLRSNRSLYFHSVDFSSISPDGRYLIFSSKDRSEVVGAISIIDLSDGKVRVIVDKEPLVEIMHLVPHCMSCKGSKFLKQSIFCNDGRSVVLWVEEKVNDTIRQSLTKVELSTGKMFNVWMGVGLTKMIADRSGLQFGLLVSDENGRKSIWHKRMNANPVRITSDNFSITDSPFVIKDLDRFSKSGRHIFFTFNKAEVMVKDSAINTTVTIWSYLDEKLQSTQSKDGPYIPSFYSAINLKTLQVTCLSGKNEWLMNKSNDDGVYLIQQMAGNADGIENLWNSAAEYTYHIRSLVKPGDVHLNIIGQSLVWLSPGGRFVVYFDKNQSSYFSYETSTGVYRKLSPNGGVSWINSFRDDLAKVPRGVAGWFTNDEDVLIYDRFDIWKINLLDRKKPMNITNGYGLQHNIIFSFGLSEYLQQSFSERDTLILNAISLPDKKNGYFEKILCEIGNPKRLTMDDCIYQLVDNHYVENSGSFPLKAKDSKKFVVQKMKATESSNLYLTTDFRTFIPITNVFPEKQYNWYTTELYKWKKEDGTTLQGVLYKPDNFDPMKKYPIIFCYYERKSFSLNEYIPPSPITNGCALNIPTFVSNGYLVFTPDIEYVIGDPMQGTYDAVVSAANYLSQKPFVDRRKMGIGGCSFGGLQTNYLITHTDLFAAAYSSSSLSDLVSAYGDIPAMYQGLSSYFESGQARMGGTLWQMQDKYIKNSPIFSADKVTTPLLLMHTTDDDIYSFSQAIEFFTALRRLGKRVWLLEYKNANHGVYGISANDFGIRMRQFFDHYLMNKPPAIWMTRGVSVKSKNSETGYELDSDVVTPAKGLLMDTVATNTSN